MKDFPTQLREYREELGCSQAQLAEAISSKLSVRTLQEWESDRGRIPPPWVIELIIARLEDFSRIHRFLNKDA